jgi:hypothetical protein
MELQIKQYRLKSGACGEKAIPNATLIEYEGEPHGVLATQQERVAQDLLHFLADDQTHLTNPF